MTAAMWRRIDRTGLEVCRLSSAPGGLRLAGTTLLAGDDGPVEFRYSVGLGPDWTTTSVGVHIAGPGEDRSLALRRDGEGRWSVGDERLERLDGAADPDLAWTPATNSIPIHRLGLEVGEFAEIQAVYVPYPGREIERRSQRYERLAPRRWRYSSGAFETDLTVDENGFVVAYPGFWTAL